MVFSRMHSRSLDVRAGKVVRLASHSSYVIGPAKISGPAAIMKRGFSRYQPGVLYIFVGP